MSKISFIIQTSHVIKPAKLRVSIYDTIIQMQKTTGNDAIGGLCERWSVDSRDLDGQTIAHIHLHKKGLGGGLVSHEATHAAFHIYQLKNIVTNLEDNDESLAYTVGDIVSKIYAQLYKRNII